VAKFGQFVLLDLNAAAHIHVSQSLPVTAFGHPLPQLSEDGWSKNFSLPFEADPVAAPNPSKRKGSFGGRKSVIKQLFSVTDFQSDSDSRLPNLIFKIADDCIGRIWTICFTELGRSRPRARRREPAPDSKVNDSRFSKFQISSHSSFFRHRLFI